ncbi:hypothetical protein [Streptomyces sp. NPDC020951]|uniref:hypothetical protein n=1 Tax=Streptomyces sp. NPDC020951 TaxID=3365104 RepID=UPI003794468B
MIGYLYSTSFASRPLFGERVTEFEERTLALLAGHADDAGRLIEHARFDVLLGPSPLNIAPKGRLRGIELLGDPPPYAQVPWADCRHACGLGPC